MQLKKPALLAGLLTIIILTLGCGGKIPKTVCPDGSIVSDKSDCPIILTKENVKIDVYWQKRKGVCDLLEEETNWQARYDRYLKELPSGMIVEYECYFNINGEKLGIETPRDGKNIDIFLGEFNAYETHVFEYCCALKSGLKKISTEVCSRDILEVLCI
ncbi:MAG: hypothetical protein ABH851_04250 [Methanobacteriota archaeon]